MNEPALLSILLTAIFGGSSTIFIYMKSEIKKRELFIEVELKKRDDIIKELQSQIMELTAKYNKLEGRNEAEDNFTRSLNHIDNKLSQLIQVKKTKNKV